MKKVLIPIFSLFIIACGGNGQKENQKDQPEKTEKKEVKKESEKKEKKENKKRSQITENEAEGNFELSIDDMDFQAEALHPDYTDFNYYFNGKESHLSIRIRDWDNNNSMMITIYAPEEKLKDPAGSYENFMMGGGAKSDVKVNLQFLIDSIENPFRSTYTMKSGKMDIIRLNDTGELEATFEGKAGTAKAMTDDSKLVPMKGTVELNTKSIIKLGEEGKKE